MTGWPMLCPDFGCLLRSFTACSAGQSMNGLTMTARGQSRWVTDKLVNECGTGYAKTGFVCVDGLLVLRIVS